MGAGVRFGVSVGQFAWRLRVRFTVKVTVRLAVQFTVQIRGELRGRVRKQEDQQGEWPPLCERSAAPSASGTLKLGTGPALPSDSATRSLPGPV